MASGELRHIVVSREGSRTLVHRQRFEKEARLQELICQHPQLLGPLGSELQFVPIGWEVQAGPGRIDLLMLDSAGLLTLVETKLEANDESRRKVVGQILEYASYVVEWSVDEIVANAAAFFASEAAPAPLHGASLRDAAAIQFGWTRQDEAEREANLSVLMANLETSLQRGHLRIVCGVDEHIGSLERLVRFLSAHSDLEVVLLQVSHFQVEPGLSVLIPTLHGDEEQADRRAHKVARLTVADLIASLDEGPGRDAVEALLDTAAAAGATFARGPSGLSIRAKCPVRQEPVTVAWIFAPGKETWMKTRDVTLGHGLDYDSTHPRLRELLDAYYADLVEAGIPGDASSKGVRARWLSPDDLAGRLEWVSARVTRVVSDLQALDAGDGSAAMPPAWHRGASESR